MKPETGSTDVARLRSLIAGYEASQVIYVAARLDVADHGGLAPLGGAGESSNLVVGRIVLPTDAGEKRIGGRRRPPIEW